MSIQYRNQTTGNLERVAGFTDVDSILSPSSKNPIANKAVYAALQQKIEKTVNDLVEYYTKSDVYNKAEVRQLIGAINTLTIAVVSTLPTSDISTTTIYFVGPATGTNTYDEYVYVNNAWVKIGDTDVDLTGYITSSQLTTVLQDYYTKSAVDALLDSYYTKTNVDNLLNDKQDTLTFDNTPTAGSDNPVKSSGIKTALDTKQATLTFDNTPTEDSANVVKSGGVYSAVDDVYKVMGENGSKNLLKYPYNQTTKTISGITFTDNGDGSITANGTATASVYLVMSLATSKDLFIKSGKYTISGCPSGGSISTYRISCGYRSGDIYRVYGNDVGNGFTFTATSDDYSDEGVYLQCACNVDNGTTVNNIVFKPMLRLAEDTDSTYQPYTKTNQQLTVDKVEQIEVNDIVNVYGAKNLIPYPYYRPSGYTTNGLTVTYDADGILTVNKVAGEATSFFAFANTEDYFLMPNTAYTLSMELENAVNTSVYIKFSNDSSDTAAIRNKATGKYETTFITPSTFNGSLQLALYYGAIVVETNAKVKVMLRLASIQDDTYVPYAKTNKELTVDKAEQAEVNDIVNVYGAKNLIPYPYSHTTKTVYGITWTDNGDGTVTVSGTATQNTSFDLTEWHKEIENINPKIPTNGGKLILSGCPSGGKVGNTIYYYLQISESVGSEIWSKSVSDYGDGAVFTPLQNPMSIYVIRIVINKDTDISTPITFKPMLRLAPIEDDTWVPYAKTNKELTKSIFDNEKTSNVPLSVMVFNKSNAVGFQKKVSDTKAYRFQMNTSGKISQFITEDSGANWNEIQILGGCVQFGNFSTTSGQTIKDFFKQVLDAIVANTDLNLNTTYTFDSVWTNVTRVYGTFCKNNSQRAVIQAYCDNIHIEGYSSIFLCALRDGTYTYRKVATTTF